MARFSRTPVITPKHLQCESANVTECINIECDQNKCLIEIMSHTLIAMTLDEEMERTDKSDVEQTG